MAVARVCVLVAVAGAAGCGGSDEGTNDGPGYAKVEEWACCIPRSSTAAPPGWCECSAEREGVSSDCPEQPAATCPASPRCVVQGSGDVWACACADEAEWLPSGDDVYPVDSCPP